MCLVRSSTDAFVYDELVKSKVMAIDKESNSFSRSYRIDLKSLSGLDLTHTGRGCLMHSADENHKLENGLMLTYPVKSFSAIASASI